MICLVIASNCAVKQVFEFELGDGHRICIWLGYICRPPSHFVFSNITLIFPNTLLKPFLRMPKPISKSCAFFSKTFTLCFKSSTAFTENVHIFILFFDLWPNLCGSLIHLCGILIHLYGRILFLFQKRNKQNLNLKKIMEEIAFTKNVADEKYRKKK